MEIYFTPGQIWAALLGGLGLIVTVGNVIKICAEMRKVRAAPDEAQDKRIAALEAWRDDVERKLITDHKRLDQSDESTRIIQQALLALMAHALDGNSVDQLKAAKAALQDYLIKK